MQSVIMDIYIFMNLSSPSRPKNKDACMVATCTFPGFQMSNDIFKLIINPQLESIISGIPVTKLFHAMI